jgi:hypothetical protein
MKTGSHLILQSTDIAYTYPDQDFCIFAKYPMNKSIDLRLGGNCENATLLFMWLCNQNFRNDQLDLMLKLCEVNGIGSNSYLSYPDYYQTRLIEMLFMELVPFVCIPIACLLGLFFNWKIIQTIRKNKKKLLKEDFYDYMSANAKFNCLYCIIYVFYPMTSCTWRLSTTFCSSIFTTQFVQFYKIVMMAYFGEVVKMCANVSYIMMTLNRYLLVGKDHSNWLVAIAKSNLKLIILGSLLISALINIGHGWEYQAVKDTVAKNSVLDKDYRNLNGESYSDYPQANQDTPYFVYSIVYFIINFGAFFILNTGIEVKIVRRMHKELKEKRERLAQMHASNLLPSNPVEASIHESTNEDKKKETEDGKKERRVIKMVILNGVLNFFLRAPDMLFWLENKITWSILLVHINDITDFNSDYILNNAAPGMLSLIADIGYLTYILTFSTNFLVFYKFNKNFKEAVIFIPDLKRK